MRSDGRRTAPRRARPPTARLVYNRTVDPLLICGAEIVGVRPPTRDNDVRPLTWSVRSWPAKWLDDPRPSKQRSHLSRPPAAKSALIKLSGFKHAGPLRSLGFAAQAGSEFAAGSNRELHGSGPGTTGSGAWGATAESLGGSWRLVAPDQAGFGRTPLPSGSAGWVANLDRAGRGTDGCPRCRVLRGGGPLDGRCRELVVGGRTAAAGHPCGCGLERWSPGGASVGRARRRWGRPCRAAGGARDARAPGLDQSLVTESAVASRAQAMQAGTSTFASVFPAPRARWNRGPDLVGADAGRDQCTRAADPWRRGPRHPVEVGGAPSARAPGGQSSCTCSGDAGTCRRSSGLRLPASTVGLPPSTFNPKCKNNGIRRDSPLVEPVRDTARRVCRSARGGSRRAERMFRTART